ncbi:MAG: gliding motility lipoprotein GldH [Bacteroidota bacterium]|nr:gliding motility lipoprotein GldH [Bacteroidota bacterium]
MLKFFVFLIVSLSFYSCTEKGKIADEMKNIQNNKWTYQNRPDFAFTVTNPNLYHNFYLKLRVEKSYPYENLYILAHMKDPMGRESTQRVNFTLMNEEGKPLGNISGNSINYELPIFKNKKLTGGAGLYFFAIEQNMRDSVINGIESIGIKVKESEPVF